MTPEQIMVIKQMLDESVVRGDTGPYWEEEHSYRQGIIETIRLLFAGEWDSIYVSLRIGD